MVYDLKLPAQMGGSPAWANATPCPSPNRDVGRGYVPECSSGELKQGPEPAGRTAGRTGAC